MKYSSRVKKILKTESKRIFFRVRDKVLVKIYKKKYHSSTGVLKTNPIVWLRTPKTASSSIKAILSSQDRVIDWTANPTVPIESTDSARKIICVAASAKSKFANQYPKIWEEAFKWAVVRNPFEKTLSAWNYLEDINEKPLLELLESPPRLEEDKTAYTHFSMGQFDLLSDDGHTVVDKVIKYENIDSELSALFDIFGLEFRGLPKVNQTISRTTYESLTFAEREAIRQRFQKDFEEFGYDVERKNDQVSESNQEFIAGGS